MNAIKYALLGLYGVVGMLIAAFGLFRLPFSEQLAKEHYRYAIGGVLVILLLLSFVVGVFILSFNANNFKTEIVHYVKEHTQRDLVLQGDIKVTFFPRLGLDTGKMLLSQRNSAREFASVNNVRLYIAWLPLLKLQLVFDHAEIDGARVNLIRYKDGTANFDDLLARDGKLLPLKFDIDSMRISDAALNWQDEMRWQRVALQDVQIETGSLAEAVPSKLKASFHINSEKARSDNRVELNSRMFIDRKQGRYEFSDIAGTLHGTVAGFSKLALSFQGDIDSHPAQDMLLAENIAVSVTGNYGQRGVTAKLAVPRLQFAKGVLGGSELALDATLAQFDEQWTTTLQMPAFEYASDRFSSAQLGGDFAFSGDRSSLQGKFSSPVTADFADKQAVRLDAVAMDITVSHPLLSGPLTAKATGSLQADLVERNAHLDFNAQLDDSILGGSLEISNFSQPSYVFALNINRLAPDRYLSSDWFKRYRDDATRIDLAGLRDMDVRGSVRVAELRAAQLEATKLSADLRIEQAVLSIEPLTARLYGGVLAGSIRVSAQQLPQLAVKQKLKGVQISALLAGSDRLTGRADIALDVGAQGASIGALRKSLAGSAELRVTHGALAGIDLRSALLEGKDELGGKGEPNVRAIRFSQHTDFSELKAVFDFSEGASRGNSFDMRTPLFRVAGVGDVYPDTASIDYRLDATVSATLNRRNAGELAEIRGVTVPVRVSGPYAAPTIALELAAASGQFVTKRSTARVVAQQAEPLAASVAKQPAPAKKTALKSARQKPAAE